MLLRKIGKKNQADDVKEKLVEMKFHQRHYDMSLSIDFNRPSPRLIEKAKEAKIDLSDDACL